MPHARIANPDQLPWAGQEVIRVVTRATTHGRRYALIWGWPTPVSELARTLMPPQPHRPVYSREARRWAKQQLDANRAHRRLKVPKAQRRWIGPITLRWLRAVARGEQPLSHRRYTSLLAYLAGPPPPPPVKLQLRLGGGALAVGFRRDAAALPADAAWPTLTPGGPRG